MTFSIMPIQIPISPDYFRVYGLLFISGPPRKDVVDLPVALVIGDIATGTQLVAHPATWNESLKPILSTETKTFRLGEEEEAIDWLLQTFLRQDVTSAPSFGQTIGGVQ